MKLHKLRSICTGIAHFGCMWNRGEIERNQQDKVVFICKNESGDEVCMQSRITAYWPDGSVKWTAHSADVKELGDNIEVSFVCADNIVEASKIEVEDRGGVSAKVDSACKLDDSFRQNENADQNSIVDCGSHAGLVRDCDAYELSNTDKHYVVEAGELKIVVNKGGEYLLDAVTKGNKTVLAKVKPVLKLEEKKEVDGTLTSIVRNYRGKINRIFLEESGPVQTTFKFEGVHVCCDSDHEGEEKFPFVIRMFIEGVGGGQIRFQHTFLYDGDENKDYLKGIGIEFESPVSGALYNRHIKFAGDAGTFHELCVPLCAWRPRMPEQFYERQLQGGIIDDEFLDEYRNNILNIDSSKNDHGDDNKDDDRYENKNLYKDQIKDRLSNDIDFILENSPHWDTYSIIQDSSLHFKIQKKLPYDDVCYIDCLHGSRSGGGCAFGSEEGSVMIAIRDFWQKNPGEISVKGLSGDTVKAGVWFYSPSVNSYDFRHYAKRGYNQVCYEGYDYKGADPVGIGCTSECAISFCDDVIASDDKLLEFTDSINNPQIYVADPKFYHDMKAFGYWSLPSKDTELEAFIEDQLDKVFEFYKEEVDQRNWYGLFNYGDFMHTYDRLRHEWKYDVGGYAWDNTELVPTLWLWTYFLRTGREDVFDLAQNLSRHASEVDMYHFGRYKGLGSRHNVRHWGCPCKEARIAMAAHHRVFYYLTGDRRFEDIFDELKDNEKSFINKDPLGDFYDKAEMVFKSHARSGPDWSSLVSNWMTQWERKNDVSYKEKIMTGIHDLEKAPLRLASGPDFEFDPESCHLRYIGERTTGGTHLQVCMGAPSVWTETADLLNYPEFTNMLVELGRFALLPHDQQLEESGKLLGEREYTFPFMFAGLSAYAASKIKNGDVTVSKFSDTDGIDEDSNCSGADETCANSNESKEGCYTEGKACANRTWKALLSSLLSENNIDGFKTVQTSNAGNKKSLSEIPWITTNFVSQWCLNVIMALDFIKDELPETIQEAVELTKENSNDAFRRA